MIVFSLPPYENFFAIDVAAKELEVKTIKTFIRSKTILFHQTQLLYKMGLKNFDLDFKNPYFCVGLRSINVLALLSILALLFSALSSAMQF